MRKIELTMTESKKYLVIKAVCDEKKQKNRACVELALSRRQVNRLMIAYQERGKKAFVHDNRQNKPTHAMPLEIKERVIKKYQSYRSLKPNVVHFCELLAEEDDIIYSDTTVRKLLYQAGDLSPKTQRKRKHITSIDKANWYLNRWIKRFNKQFAKRQLSLSSRRLQSQLNEIFYLLESLKGAWIAVTTSVIKITFTYLSRGKPQSFSSEKQKPL